MVTQRMVDFTEKGVSERFVKSGPPQEAENGRSFLWDELIVVALQGIDSDDRSFWSPQADWLLTTLIIPSFFVTFSDARQFRMLRHMSEHLPGFSHDQALFEARKKEIGRVIVWQRQNVQCPSCGRAVLTENRVVRSPLIVLTLECGSCGASFDLEQRCVE